MEVDYAKLLSSCIEHGCDPGIIAFASYDTCGPESPVRNCMPGNALYMGVMAVFLGIEVGSTDKSRKLRDCIRTDLMTGDLMKRSMKVILKEFFSRLKGNTREEKMQVMMHGKKFLTDVVANGGVGTDVFRDAALDKLKKVWGGMTAQLTDTGGWDTVRFPIVFHLQWDKELTKAGKPRMMFHTAFDPWRMAVGLALALCGHSPPIQVIPLLLETVVYGEVQRLLILKTGQRNTVQRRQVHADLPASAKVCDRLGPLRGGEPGQGGTHRHVHGRVPLRHVCALALSDARLHEERGRPATGQAVVHVDQVEDTEDAEQKREDGHQVQPACYGARDGTSREAQDGHHQGFGDGAKGQAVCVQGHDGEGCFTKRDSESWKVRMCLFFLQFFTGNLKHAQNLFACLIVPGTQIEA